GITADAATRAALDACVKDNAREARPRHKYSADEFGLTPEGIEADFAFYHDKYLKK
ncbi:MAG: sulfotransferase, partial [Sphingomonadaceae bacterium]|nr:sulfotransferase [Sphingomonadaceae bacterium]